MLAHDHILTTLAARLMAAGIEAHEETYVEKASKKVNSDSFGKIDLVVIPDGHTAHTYELKPDHPDEYEDYISEVDHYTDYLKEVPKDRKVHAIIGTVLTFAERAIPSLFEPIEIPVGPDKAVVFTFNVAKDPGTGLPKKGLLVYNIYFVNTESLKSAKEAHDKSVAYMQVNQQATAEAQASREGGRAIGFVGVAGAAVMTAGMLAVPLGQATPGLAGLIAFGGSVVRGARALFGAAAASEARGAASAPAALLLWLSGRKQAPKEH